MLSCRLNTLLPATVKILLVRLGSLGDLVHAVPVAAALRERHPAARIDWLVDARYAAVLDLLPIIDRRIVISPSGLAARADRPGHPGDRRFSGLRGVVGAIREPRRQQYDAAVDLQGLIKSAVLARASGARRVLGFEREQLRERQASLFYTETCPFREPEGSRHNCQVWGEASASRVPPSQVWGEASASPKPRRHVVFKNLSVLPALDTPVPVTPRFPLAIPVSPALEAFRETLGATGRDGFALLNPGAAWPNKRWPAERFGKVASALRARHGLASVVSWGPGEEGLARAVAAASDGAALSAPPTRVADLLAFAAEARLVVSGDTGPLHLAAAVGTPIVALFGPTDPDRNGPWADADVSLSRFADCVCHYVRRCRRERPCIEDITVEDVLGAIERRLAIAKHPQA